MKKNIGMINQVPAIGELNAVEGFNPAEYLNRNVADASNESMTLDVEYKKLWFRLKYPLGKITKSIVQLTEQLAILEARVYVNKEDGPDNYIANAFARIHSDADNLGENHLKIAETTAIEQALADAGFGVQFCCVTEGGESPMDNPVIQTEPPNNPAPQNLAQAKPNPQGQPANPVTTQQEPTTTNQTVAAAGQPPQQEPARLYDSTMPVEEIIKMMTLEDAKNIIVPLGFHKGKTFGQLAIEKPGAIEWYIRSYTGNDNILRAGATVLINAAMGKAS